jgi:phage antirepressor YoqD-like protein/predicted transcriptional regulator
MNDLILTQNQTLTMSSREIASVVKSRHDSVKRTMITLQQKGLIAFTQTVEKGEGRPAEVYHVNKRDSYVVVAQLSPEFTAVLVDRWQELENRNKPKLPQTFAEALQLAADQARQLELAAPKVEFHDKIVNDEKTFSFRDAAKKIQQRPNKFIAWLRESGYICLNNLAKQQYITQGLFATHSGVSESEHHFTQCRVTSKGLSYFTSKLGEVRL